MKTLAHGVIIVALCQFLTRVGHAQNIDSAAPVVVIVLPKNWTGGLDSE
jgi:hypothetical protein